MVMNNEEAFINYISSPLSDDLVKYQFNLKKITPIKCELYGDFISSLFRIVIKTYLGDDDYVTTERQIEHFNWCWKENVGNFEKEGIVFTNTKIYDYLIELVFENFYTEADKSSFQSTINVLEYIFIYDGKKTKSDLDLFFEIYNIFNE